MLIHRYYVARPVAILFACTIFFAIVNRSTALRINYLTTSPLSSRIRRNNCFFLCCRLPRGRPLSVSRRPPDSNASSSSPKTLASPNTVVPTPSKFLELEDVGAPSDREEAAVLTADRTRGLLILLSVPVVWGTYAPAVRYLYAVSDPPLPGLIFSAAYYSLASATLSIVAATFSNIDDSSRNVPNREGTSKEIAAAEEKDTLRRDGSELGAYLTFANALQVLGLMTVDGDRAAFLVQTTTVMVPILFGLSNLATKKKMNVDGRTWSACGVATAGVYIISSGGGGGLGGIGTGDILILGAAVIYSLHVLRLSALAPRHDALDLAEAKAAFEAKASIAIVIGMYLVGSMGSIDFSPAQDVYFYMTEGYKSISTETLGRMAATVAWTGWVTCAYTIYAQSAGQRVVKSPVTANLIYSSQPLWSAALGYLLNGEMLDGRGCAGAALVGLAVAMVTLKRPNESDVATVEN